MSLCLHSGATARTFEEIRSDYRVPTHRDLEEAWRGKDGTAPKGLGNRWNPIHHADLIAEIRGAANDMNLSVSEELFGLSKDSHDIFGFMRFTQESVEAFPTTMAPVLGFRASNMQRFALRGVSGSSVFVCDNMALVGDFIFGFKRTSGQNYSAMDVKIAEGMQKWESQAKRMAEFVDAMQAMTLSRVQADHLLLEAAREKVYSCSQITRIDAIYREYATEDGSMRPEVREAFAPRNAWSLYNSVNEVTKGYKNPVRAESTLKGFPRVAARMGGFADLLDAPAELN
jgi:hypothetical protein